MDPLDLVADCSSCFGLCCVALAFERSADFPVDKDAGEPCTHLADDFSCSIHSRLREEGFRGSAAYDCFGAGQQVSQVTYGGVSWREAPSTSATMFAALPIMRQLHEIAFYLADALARDEAAPVLGDLLAAARATETLTQTSAAELPEVDLPAHRVLVDPLLRRASELVRGGHGGPDRAGADLLGARLRGADLRGANLRGALLIAADLREADLRTADLIGADLRDARLEAADLREALFCTQTQVNSARGDAATRLPAGLRRPAHWE